MVVAQYSPGCCCVVAIMLQLKSLASPIFSVVENCNRGKTIVETSGCRPLLNLLSVVQVIYAEHHPQHA